ncbi:DMT family transporter [uncultured Aquabacterium sp.]|uniref:DMT family transporter n=1 Tax=Aquabacterium sp. TaxID=1872578 RepID=UPI0025E329C1|nr:DMT family transporter [uncultured Aquabacterium sp.]
MRATFNRLSAPWLMVTATVLFALMGVCVKMASQTASTGEVVFFRGGVGAVMMGLLAWRTGLSLRTAVPLLHVQRGASGVTALALWFYTLGTLPLSTAVTLNYMSSVWMAVFLVLQLAWRRWRGQDVPTIPLPLLGAVVVGFLGVTLVLRPTIERDLWLQGLVGLASGMLSAVAYFQVASLGRAGEPEVRVVFYFSLFGAVSGLLISGVEALYRGSTWSWPTDTTLLWLLGTGLFATLAQVCMTRAYARGNALVMASLQYLGIAHAFVLGVLLFDDPVHAVAVVGMALIVLAGIAATQASAPLKTRR